MCGNGLENPQERELTRSLSAEREAKSLPLLLLPLPLYKQLSMGTLDDVKRHEAGEVEKRETGPKRKEGSKGLLYRIGSHLKSQDHDGNEITYIPTSSLVYLMLKCWLNVRISVGLS